MLKIVKFIGSIKLISLVLVGVGMGSIAYGEGTMPELGAYERLSPANKKIAEALFNGQVVTPNGKDPLSLDLIAASKRRDGWGRIFRRLKRDGLIEAKNLKELTSGRQRSRTAGKRVSPNRRARPTVVTTGAGRQVIVGKKNRLGKSRRNLGRQLNRRGTKSTGAHSEALFGSGSTYRGRADYSGDTRDASSLGIATGKGVGTSDFIATTPK